MGFFRNREIRWLCSVLLACLLPSPLYLARGERFEGKALVIASLLVCALIVVGLDVYYSWAVDYQPQGRYLMGALVPLMLLAAAGLDALASGLYREGGRLVTALSRVAPAIPVGYALLFAYVLVNYIVPRLTGGIGA